MRTAWIWASVALLSGCSMDRINPWGGPVEHSRIPRDATVYECEGGKQLVVQYEANNRWALIIFPERDFRLDAVKDAPGRFSNGRSTLALQEGVATLDEAGTVSHRNCKSAAK